MLNVLKHLNVSNLFYPSQLTWFSVSLFIYSRFYCESELHLQQRFLAWNLESETILSHFSHISSVHHVFLLLQLFDLRPQLGCRTWLSWNSFDFGNIMVQIIQVKCHGVLCSGENMTPHRLSHSTQTHCHLWISTWILLVFGNLQQD